MSSGAVAPLLTRRVPLGRTGINVSPLGLGGAWIGQTAEGCDEELAVRTVVRAVELGINLIDTSPLYQHGESERRIGRALGELRRRGFKREDLVICTKAGTRTRPYDYSGDAIRRSLELSLQAQRAHALWTFARERAVPLLALNLQFIFREPRIATTLLGAGRPDEIEEDVRMALHPLPEGIWAELQRRLNGVLK